MDSWDALRKMESRRRAVPRPCHAAEAQQRRGSNTWTLERARCETNGLTKKKKINFPIITDSSYKNFPHKEPKIQSNDECSVAHAPVMSSSPIAKPNWLLSACHQLSSDHAKPHLDLKLHYKSNQLTLTLTMCTSYLGGVGGKPDYVLRKGN